MAYTSVRTSDDEESLRKTAHYDDKQQEPSSPSRRAGGLTTLPYQLLEWIRRLSIVKLTVLGGLAFVVCVMLFGPRTTWKKKPPRDVNFFAGSPAEFGMRNFKVATKKQLLTRAAPSSHSLYDSLIPGVRYLTCDSWSGMTGQFLTALPLIYLASITQRVAIIPGWNNDEHYGNIIVKMSDIFDLEAFRQKSGILFVEWDDVKPLDPEHKRTQMDELGCWSGNNPFMDGMTFKDHNIKQTLFKRQNFLSHQLIGETFESFVLHDYDESVRMDAAQNQSEEMGVALPRNMKDGQLLCYTNLWDQKHAWGGYSRDKTTDLMPYPLRGWRAEWWAVGQHMNFTEPIWDVALDLMERTLGNKFTSPDLITVHIRRGDFNNFCQRGYDCLSKWEDYVSAVSAAQKLVPWGTPVLVTTDEVEDHDFLAKIDRKGWYRIDHVKLGTAAILDEKFGHAARWVDSAIDQAILSTGMHFIGTEGSQVSWVSELRVIAWHDGTSKLVTRPPL